ncbi:hypothetical protein AKUG0406_PLPX00340 (plasmid) [Apilactobacillus kunkeei]|nr:hypothetical protein AKUG0406_PLPX00340 [Apilactobacillus kunkeei]CAI2675984.1 hypothetical protein AKUG0403_PLPX00320 [Apilactobacillus kunkeei]CAI2678007.1 hypothetical protein AKUH3B103M_PLPX00320 [Apilactobacillus kunkeei]CAI2678013.1 hypothetical protein AKUH3B111A_PLPX00310 [Apilactobacillus kunkeei]CAI2678537.1 hypothetical protein AKUH3B104X_PLPX00340 [Apilactobacillus kunkeei]
MEKFTKLYKRFAEEGLSPNEQVALSYMYDRMDLSEGNNNFYDNQHNSYYITYSRSELSKQLNVSEATVTSIFNKLVKKGWLIIKRRFNSTNRIFLPKSLKSNNSTSKIKKVDSNYTEFNNTNTNKLHDNNDTKKIVRSLELNGLSQSLVNKAGFSPRLVSQLKTLSFNNPDKLYDYGKVILKAKRNALRFSVPKRSELRMFETNPLLNEYLEKNTEPIIRNANRKAKNSYGYMLKSFKNLFEEAIDDYSQQIHDNDNIERFLPGNLAFLK